MIIAGSVPRSAKREGRHEARIIERLVPFFEAAGYDAVPHAMFCVITAGIDACHRRLIWTTKCS